MLSNQIISWYLQNKRDLPWRKTKDPYQIWISEIMLQQTKVATVIDYFSRFLNQFPTISDLANAEEQEVLKIWQGLGYYSRARNLHAAAKTIQSEYNGVFPNSYKEILKLKGIGSYTAAAIASFAFQLPYAAVDGNVYRVLSRIYGINLAIDSTEGKKYFQNIASETMEKAPAEIYNQAIIEFGALQCIPRNPKCEICPLSSQCFAYNAKQVDQFPIKSKQIKVKNRYFYYLFLSCENRFLIEKRKEKDIWENLFQYPLIECDKQVSTNELIQTKEWEKLFENLELVIRSVSEKVVHKLSHQNLHTTFIHIEINIDKLKNKNGYQVISYSEISKYPFPKLIEDHLNKITKNNL
ncbi:A/G-specific adenine glycosylase [Labilibaculum filiforme]|uniref:Adenine DNA glycosylase n=1 Tax=Labilibaculum filiforme TaxID=1940526 RepID=A0A2N3I5T5_9BACT|nr:A/G-specific adenine glycosylase [Labilibaculum filiforme]PKQ65672.1 A/G-specific adenine glycosylase [Labilibaculum filiforme]